MERLPRGVYSPVGCVHEVALRPMLALFRALERRGLHFHAERGNNERLVLGHCAPTD